MKVAKRKQERELAHRASVRQSSAEVFKEMFNLQHEVEWITWYAANNPASVGKKMAAQYNSSIHQSIPRLLGSLAILASLDERKYSELSSIANRLFELEGRIALLVAKVGSTQLDESSIEELANHFPAARDLWTELPLQMAMAMK